MESSERYRYSSFALLKFFGNISLAKITPKEVEKFKTSRAAEMVTVRGKAKDKRKSTGIMVRQPATVNRELACLRANVQSHGKGPSLKPSQPGQPAE